MFMILSDRKSNRTTHYSLYAPETRSQMFGNFLTGSLFPPLASKSERLSRNSGSVNPLVRCQPKASIMCPWDIKPEVTADESELSEALEKEVGAPEKSLRVNNADSEDKSKKTNRDRSSQNLFSFLTALPK